TGMGHALSSAHVAQALHQAAELRSEVSASAATSSREARLKKKTSRKPPLVSILLFAAGVPVAQASAGECWMDGLNYENCCLPLPDGNPSCWDEYFTAALCCRDAPPAVLDPPLPLLVPPADAHEGDPDHGASGDSSGGRGLYGGCEWSFFQEFK
ncbi:unnamed protein product, partial [Polarella glacialis]